MPENWKEYIAKIVQRKYYRNNYDHFLPEEKLYCVVGFFHKWNKSDKNLITLKKYFLFPKWLTVSNRSHISDMPSAEGISNLTWYLFWLKLTSGVTSQPFRLTCMTGSIPRAAASEDLYAAKTRSRQTKNKLLNDFRVNLFGLKKRK